MDAQERVARILCRLMGDEWQLGEHLYRNTADEIIATLAPAPNVAPREAGEAAFYADEGNIPSCLKAAFDAYEAAALAAQTDLATRLAAVVRWLEANQPDAFQRGLWDALPNTKEG